MIILTTCTSDIEPFTEEVDNISIEVTDVEPIENVTQNIIFLNPPIPWEEQFDIMHPQVLASPYTFSDMEYVLLVRRAVDRFSASEFWFEYALIGASYTSFDEGQALYENINTLYIIRREPTLMHDTTGNFVEVQEYGLIRRFFERHVIRFSTDGTQVITQTHLSEWSYPVLYEIFRGQDNLANFTDHSWYTHMENITRNFRFKICFEYLFPYVVFKNVYANEKFKILSDGCIILNAEETQVAYIVRYEEGFFIRVHVVSTNENIFLSDLIVPDRFFSLMHLDDSQIIFRHSFNYYKINREDNTITFLFTKPYGIFSPDARFFAYTSIQPLDLLEFPDVTAHLEFGIYIFDRFTDKTVFYPIEVNEDDCCVGYSIILWTNLSALYELLDK